MNSRWLALIAIVASLFISLDLHAHSKKVLLVSAAHSNKAKVTALKSVAKVHHLGVEAKSEASLKDVADLNAMFSKYDMVIFDSVSKRESKRTYAKYIGKLASVKAKMMLMHPWQETGLFQGLTSEQAQRVRDYYINGGKENFERLTAYFQKNVFSRTPKEVAEPIIFPKAGIYHPSLPQRVSKSLAEYQQQRRLDGIAGDHPKVAILFQRALLESEQMGLVNETIQRLEDKGSIAIPFYFELSPRSGDYSHLLQVDGKTQVDLIINFRAIHWANKRKKEFERWGVPVVQALTYYDGEQTEWEESSQGISPGMTPFVFVLPETSGVIGPIIVAAIDAKTGQSKMIDYQLDYMIERSLKLANLRYKSNANKKMTVMVWGDRDAGASFMNVPESLASISRRLNKEGYQVEAVQDEYFTSRIDRILTPFYRNYELDKLVEDDLAELMPVAEYLSWFNTLPEEVRAPINKHWGKAEDNFMVVQHQSKPHFVIPRIRNGSMLVMRQPPRADNKGQDVLLYHKGTVPMNHFYLAAYYYARAYWGSDAIVHLGTHGSQEYLAGKERGLSRYDDGSLAVGTTPVIYPFIIDDVGEAMQTKRRGSAVVISHLTPPFASAGLQGDIADIHELMHQYKALDEGGVKERTAAQITEHCMKSNICKDLGWEDQRIKQEFELFLEELHNYMEELATQLQPLGLHTFGELSEQKLLISTVTQMLGKDFMKEVSDFENEMYQAGHHDHSDGSDHHHDDGGDDHSHGPDTHTHEGSSLHSRSEAIEDTAGFKTVRDYVVAKPTKALPDSMSEALKEHIERAKEYYTNLKGIKELDSLVDALSGRYIPVKTGGDPVRHPESLPSGTNLYGFDPSRLPTKAAYEQGKSLVTDVINDYYKKHGQYPDKLAFSLWSIEAMRHYGVLESQALYALGVKPKWSPDGRVIGTEIIPAGELKRPRVDVVLSATGLYRDAFPNVMQRLAKAIKQIAELKEENNSVWKNSQRVKRELIAEGIEEQEAEYLSSVRIFSNESGQYGSGVDGPVFASDSWETDKKIADNYLSNMGFAYGADPSRWGEQGDNTELYAKQLSGTDVAMFSRSSNVYGMLSSDDPFEYFGALALAVRNIDGKSPEMKISNLRNATNAKMESADRFLAKELRTRVFHKRWIEEMQKEGYSGAVALSSRVSNFWGWQVVDPNLVRSDQWKEFYDVYIKDKHDLKLNEWFEQVNPGAQAQMIERMLEANRKEYWQASDEVRKELIERFAELVEKYDLFVDNEKLQDYVIEQGKGFGLNMSQDMFAEQSAETEEANASEASVEQITGQKLEKVEASEIDDILNWRLITVAILSLLMFLLGMIVQSQRRYNT
ncbi:cobaltochelatase subunit CobN [Pleionea sp. CnH1-48]|uniref:cobaltochelatase subunit CobN n=1 Tax=Pleionea sp. CnH1-48 TaxID=2954494 RepID=UPI0020971928|nr:cobaltochelatase subunit CobN [Pleionea sp. CnH1-48]MCO7222954.1 cobaltochelatase subunit CobN [Pleionea sp. CnH1-48]